MKTFIAAAALIIATSANAGIPLGPFTNNSQAEDSNDTSRVEDNQVIVAGFNIGPLANNSQTAKSSKIVVAGLPIGFSRHG